jgi:hypothetical protein
MRNSREVEYLEAAAAYLGHGVIQSFARAYQLYILSYPHTHSISDHGNNMM